MKLAIKNTDDLIFGCSPNKISCRRDIMIGNGTVIPEINFTLPTMMIQPSTWKEITTQYRQVIRDLCQRSVELQNESIVFEYELLPPMTQNPAWGSEITAIFTEILDEYYNKYKLASALRVTPVDIRDIDRPPLMRNGKWTEIMFESFEQCARTGADMLSIESTGGKEVHDDALMAGDLTAIICALGVLAPLDMEFIWKKIVRIADSHQIIPAGDTACGFGNTAMVLADQKMIPRTLAAVVRVASIIRSLKAYEVGARGPSKDCAYEGPFLKVLTGTTISMEGKSSAGAHLSTIGNISAAYCDLWSNESIQNIKLLSASAPVVGLEQLIYDCRLMNTALRSGQSEALRLRNWLVESDCHYDPQAYIFKPEVIMQICREILNHTSDLERVVAVVRLTLQILREAVDTNELKLEKTDLRWLNMLSVQADSLPTDPSVYLAHLQTAGYAKKILTEEYITN